jgi:2-dehydro-3-deoxyphosphogluconate aldolase/(4S)-4-hydroxy-2-oxoglutarate aldolase
MSFPAVVVGILRGVDPGFFPEAMGAAFEAGLEALEVTMNTDGAEGIISRSRPSVPRGRLLGMGTVRSVEEAERAVVAGAMFLVTPNTDPSVIEYARSRDVPVIAGALTPTEVQAAWSAGASLVKVFPCGALGGPRYLAALKGPFDRIPLMPVGGVGLSNIEDYFRAGASAVGVGTALFGRDALEEKNAVKLERNVRHFVEHCPVRPTGGGHDITHNKGEGNVQTRNQGH